MNFISTKIAYAAGTENLDKFLKNVNSEIINPLITFLFALAILYFLYGMFEFIWHGSSEEKKTVGKNNMLWGIIGLTIMMGVWFILGMVLSTLHISKDQINPETGTVNLPDLTK